MIDGNQLDRIFHHHSGNLYLRKLTLQNGYVKYGFYPMTEPAGAALLSDSAGSVDLYKVVVRNHLTESANNEFCNAKKLPNQTTIGKGNSIYYQGEQLSMTNTEITNQKFICLGQPANHFLYGEGTALFAKTSTLIMNSVLIANNKISADSYEEETVHLDCYGRVSCNHSINNIALFNNGRNNLSYEMSLESVNNTTIDIDQLISIDGEVSIKAINRNSNKQPKVNISVRNSTFEKIDGDSFSFVIDKSGKGFETGPVIVDGLIEHSTFSGGTGIAISISQLFENDTYWLLRNNTISGNKLGLLTDGIHDLTLIYNTIAFNWVNIFPFPSNDGEDNINLMANIISDSEYVNCMFYKPELLAINTLYNVDDDNTCVVHDDMSIGNIILQDPMLKPLADNGSYTKTHALKWNSPAIDASKITVKNTGTVYDQRYVLRTSNGVGNSPDIGAFEVFEKPPVFEIPPCNGSACGEPEN